MPIFGGGAVLGGFQVFVPAAFGTAIGGMTAAGALAASFDGVTSQLDAACSQSGSIAAGFVTANAVGKDWGAGVTKTISKVIVYSPSDQNFLGPGGATTGKLQGSTDNFSSSVVDLMTAVALPTGFSQVVTVLAASITLSNAYRYHRFVGNGNGTNLVRFAELQFFEDL